MKKEAEKIDDVYTEAGKQLLAILDEGVKNLQGQVGELEAHLVHLTGMARYENERECASPSQLEWESSLTNYADKRGT